MASGNLPSTSVPMDPVRAQLETKQEKHCIGCGKRDGPLSLCARCNGAWYCSKGCQKLDWPVHKILCAEYAKLGKLKPEEGGSRATLLRHDACRPEMIILPGSPSIHATRSLEPVRKLLRLEDAPAGNFYAKYDSVGRCQFGFNSRIGVDYISKYGLSVIYRDNFRIDSSPRTKALYVSVKASGFVPPTPWAGSIVVKRNQGSVTMADFRHAIDWLGLYPQHELYGHFGPRTPTAVLQQRLWPGIQCWPPIKGVRIKCDQHIKDESERYSTEMVPGTHPIRGLEVDAKGTISPISAQLGLPLRLLITPSRAPEFSPNNPPAPLSERGYGTFPSDGPGRARCVPVVHLMRSLDQKNLGRFGLCPWQHEFSAGALVVRADDKDLTEDEVKAMVHFIKEKCLDRFSLPSEVLGECDRDLGSGPGVGPFPAEVSDAVQEVMGLISRENYLKSFEELELTSTPMLAVNPEILDLRGTIEDIGNPFGEEGFDDDAYDDESDSDGEDVEIEPLEDA